MAVSDFYERRFDVELDPEREIIPAIGAKEAIFNLNLAFLDPGDYALAADPGYPVYTAGPWLAGAEPVLMALEPKLGFVPDLDAIDEATAKRAKLMFLNYPNNPTGAVVPVGFFERVVEFAREHEILVVHDNAYSEIVFDGYRAPSFLATPGAKEVGIEVFSLSKGYNMTGWRCAVVVGNAEAVETYWRLKTNVDSGLFEAVQLAGVAALSPDADAGGRLDERAVQTPPRSRLRGTAGDRRRRASAAQHDLCVGARPGGLRELGGVLRARARAGCRRALARRDLRTRGGGLVPDLLDDARRSFAGGGRAIGQAGVLDWELNGSKPKRPHRDDLESVARRGKWLWL